jgi:hypothetical protein
MLTQYYSVLTTTLSRHLKNYIIHEKIILTVINFQFIIFIL